MECGLTLGWTAAANVITLGLGAKVGAEAEALDGKNAIIRRRKVKIKIKEEIMYFIFVF